MTRINRFPCQWLQGEEGQEETHAQLLMEAGTHLPSRVAECAFNMLECSVSMHAQREKKEIKDEKVGQKPM